MLKPHNYVMTRLYSGLELPQFWEVATKKWEQVDPGTEDWLYLQQPRWLWSDPRTNLKMTLRDDCAVSACSAPTATPSVKALTPYLLGRGGGRTLDRSLAPSPYQVLAPEMKQTFPSTNLACLLAFEGQAATTGLRSGPKSPLFRKQED